MAQKEELEWWKHQLMRLRSQIKVFLAWKHPDLSQHFDDLSSDTIEAITRYVSTNASRLPQSWYQTNENIVSTSERKYLNRLAMTIVNRRVIDFRRKNQTELKLYEHISSVSYPEQSSVERKVFLANVLAETAFCIQQFPEKDRELLIGTITSQKKPKALSDKDRKRLNRLRKKIASILRHRLGEKVVDLLAENFK